MYPCLFFDGSQRYIFTFRASQRWPAGLFLLLLKLAKFSLVLINFTGFPIFWSNTPSDPGHLCSKLGLILKSYLHTHRQNASYCYKLLTKNVQLTRKLISNATISSTYRGDNEVFWMVDSRQRTFGWTLLSFGTVDDWIQGNDIEYQDFDIFAHFGGRILHWTWKGF